MSFAGYSKLSIQQFRITSKGLSLLLILCQQADGRHCVYYFIILITVNKQKFHAVFYSSLQQMPVFLCTYAAEAHFLEEQLNINHSS